ncbi:hypothetical protein [Pseudonocardia adelaidensis]|uniref:Uncharacterized protein n=1 Tax=Pseudonocardia adelaidensis TaxID=648754 RepID=A0ABP9NR72_9PSEU
MKRRERAALAARARDADTLAEFGSEIASKGRELQGEMEGLTEAVDAALATLKASGVDLCGRVRRIRQLTAEMDERAREAHTLAGQLGIEAGPVQVPDPLEEIRRAYPDADLHRLRVFDAALKTPGDVAHELGDAVSTQLHAEHARDFGDFPIGRG